MEIRSFEEIIGHEDVIRHLRSAVRKGSVGHAYIFSGESGSGKKTLASVFACTLLCTDPEAKETADPCGICQSCRKAFSNNHPDMIYVEHEKPQVITVDEIREQVVSTAEVKPYEGRYKIYIISDAEKMNPQAQNALLKTIEEPPEYVILLLLSANAESLLPTIRSRCVTLEVRPTPKELIREHLVKELHVPAQEAEIMASFSQGNLGKARSAALGGDFSKMVENALGIVTNIKKMPVRQAIAICAGLVREKQNIYDYLDIFTLWYRDVLLFKATRDVDALAFRRYTKEITEAANVSGYEGLELCLKAIDTARARLKANVSFEITMELLFMTLMEN